jgi:hypothetical protein
MTSLTENLAAVSSNVIAGLLLAAKTLLDKLELPHPRAAQILQATSAGRTRAYEYKSDILNHIEKLTRPAGRPPRAVLPAVNTDLLSRKVLRFVMDHPGCVSHRGTERQRYSDDFRDFLLGLWEKEQANMDLSTFTRATEVPLGTFKDWVRAVRPRNAEAVAEDQTNSVVNEYAGDEKSLVTSTHLETILAEWRTWRGDFVAFCDHLKKHLRIPHGRTLIANILEQLGERHPQRRQGRSPDEKALRGAFETFFPGAQWTGDGSPITVTLDGQQFTFNLELMVDTDSAALVGASLRDEEDSAAVTTAFADGVQTTGASPLSLLLDLRSCNHTAEVNHALDDTLNIPATKGRAQNKAHVEGGFGLFQQTAPALEITAESPREQARQLLLLVFQTWARTLNHKPRPVRNGQSRVQQYQSAAPTPQQVAQAKAALEERLRRQKEALETNKARTDPVTRQLLEEAFARLDLADPTGNISAAIARYPLDAILTGISTFEGKREANTLPNRADARYLLGIVHNVSHQHEGWLISEALIKARLQAQDLLLRGLQRARHDMVQTINKPGEIMPALLENALDTDRRLDRLFWLQSVADIMRAQPIELRDVLWRSAHRRIHSTFRLPYVDRLAAVHFLATKVVSLD